MGLYFHVRLSRVSERVWMGRGLFLSVFAPVAAVAM